MGDLQWMVFFWIFLMFFSMNDKMGYPHDLGNLDIVEIYRDI